MAAERLPPLAGDSNSSTADMGVVRPLSRPSVARARRDGSVLYARGKYAVMSSAADGSSCRDNKSAVVRPWSEMRVMLADD
jgi:hypothetical protein